MFLSKDELIDVLNRVFSISIGLVDEFAEKIQNKNENELYQVNCRQ